MITYESNANRLSFIFRLDGSTLPKAAIFASPSLVLCLTAHFVFARVGVPDTMDTGIGILGFVWSASFFTLTFLVGFRCHKAYSRFWEGCSLMQQMSAEWFESASTLIAFSNAARGNNPGKKDIDKAVQTFQATLVRLMSMLHGVALRQVSYGQEFVLLDVLGLDYESLDYLQSHCGKFEINRAEVVLHWIQVLITESLSNGVIVVAPPIVTRCFQTLSRGMVHLHRVRMIADIPFPFPLNQALVVMLLIQSFIMPAFIAIFFQSILFGSAAAYLPCVGMWCLNFICDELEQPFGVDPNDLPLKVHQFDFNNSLLMLIHPKSNVVPMLAATAPDDAEGIRDMFGDPDNTTRVVYNDAKLVSFRHVLRDVGRYRNMASTANVNKALDLLESSAALDNDSVETHQFLRERAYTKHFARHQTKDTLERQQTAATSGRARNCSYSDVGGSSYRSSSATSDDVTPPHGPCSAAGAHILTSPSTVVNAPRDSRSTLSSSSGPSDGVGEWADARDGRRLLGEDDVAASSRSRVGALPAAGCPSIQLSPESCWRACTREMPCAVFPPASEFYSADGALRLPPSAAGVPDMSVLTPEDVIRGWSNGGLSYGKVGAFTPPELEAEGPEADASHLSGPRGSQSGPLFSSVHSGPVHSV